MSLSNANISPTIPASDMERAKKFYEEKLGLKKQSETPAGAVYQCGGGTWFFLFPSPNAGKCPTTYAGWEVKDIDAEVKEFKAKGVVFEEYDTPAYKTVDGVATLPDGTKAAWFKDSEGNILAISKMS